MKKDPYLHARPLSDYDLEIAVGVLFGTVRDRARELTPEQKAEADAQIAPYMRGARR